MDYYKEAEYWLNIRREGTQKHHETLDYIVECLKAGNLTTQDINASEAEAEELHAKVACELYKKV